MGGALATVSISTRPKGVAVLVYRVTHRGTANLRCDLATARSEAKGGRCSGDFVNVYTPEGRCGLVAILGSLESAQCTNVMIFTDSKAAINSIKSQLYQRTNTADKWH